MQEHSIRRVYSFGLDVLGGCLRKGIGVPKNVQLGIGLIDYCASVGNPSGINKQVSMLEELGHYKESIDLLEECIASGMPNALLYFNLGYLLLVDPGESKQDDVITTRQRGQDCWRQAIDLAPDEGSEEAAYFSSRQSYQSPKESMRLLNLAADLGFPDAREELGW
jgi:TPR repeat protein